MRLAAGTVSLIVGVLSVVLSGHPEPSRTAVPPGTDDGRLAELRTIPRGKPILPNGLLSRDEWEDAARFEFERRVALLVKQDDRCLYLGLEFLADMHTGVDLYVALPSGRRWKLHVSGAVGQAERGNGNWSEIQWGENRLWAANSIGTIIVEERQQVVRLEGFEFQVDKRLFPGDRLLVRAHLKRPEYVLPPGADAEEVADWFGLDLSGRAESGADREGRR